MDGRLDGLTTGSEVCGLHGALGQVVLMSYDIYCMSFFAVLRLEAPIPAGFGFGGRRPVWGDQSNAEIKLAGRGHFPPPGRGHVCQL